MKKKIFKSLLAIACLLGSTNVSAYDFEVNGIYYDVVSFSELTCKVVKEASNKYYEGDVVIPATVNYSNRTLTIVEIGNGVFRNCSNLTGISIPNTISSIGNEMFNGCSKLESVTIEDGETVLNLGYNLYHSGYGIGKGLFYDCPIKNLYLGRNLSYKTEQYYGYSPFANNKTIKEVTIGNSVTEIGYRAFDGCSGLKKVIVKDIAAWCNISFSGQSSNPLYYAHTIYSDEETEITDLVIPNSVTKIGSYAFYGCSGLTSITIPYSVTSIGSYAFYDCSGLTSITIPNSVTSIDECAFYGCSGLESVTIGNFVTSIGSSAFYGCSGLTSITIPYSVTEIGYRAFYDCSGLTSVTIGNSVTKIGSYAFYGCDALTTLYSLNTIPPSVGSNNFTNNQYMTLNVFVLKEALEAYQKTEPWKNFWNLEESKDLISRFEVDGIEYMVTTGTDVIIIGENLSQQTDLIIENQVEYSDIKFNVVSISSDAFKNCSNLSTINIKPGIKSIGDNCFEGCSNLSDVILPSDLMSIGNAAFKNCSSITEIALPTQITTIPAECFYGCTKLTKIELDNIVELGNQCFQNCKSLESMLIPNTVTKFGEMSFNGCSNLKELTFEEGTQPLIFPSGAYDSATGIQKKEVNGKTIQFQIQYYKGYFSGLPIEKLYIGRNLSDNIRYTISGNGGVDYYIITSYDTPFCSLSNLNEITIGENVTTLGPTEKFISEIGTYITAGAFKSCSAIKAIYVKNPTPPSGAEFSSTVYYNAKLYVPENTVTLYANTDGWKEFINIIDSSIIFATNIELNNNAISIKMNEEYQLVATVYPEETTDKTISWSSSNSDVASVSETGLVTGLSKGTATITATCGEVSATCEVEVVEETGIYDIYFDENESVVVYNLQGVRMNVSTIKNLSTLPKGTYIVNGKKVIVK